MMMRAVMLTTEAFRFRLFIFFPCFIINYNEMFLRKSA